MSIVRTKRPASVYLDDDDDARAYYGLMSFHCVDARREELFLSAYYVRNCLMWSAILRSRFRLTIGSWSGFVGGIVWEAIRPPKPT